MNKIELNLCSRIMNYEVFEYISMQYNDSMDKNTDVFTILNIFLKCFYATKGAVAFPNTQKRD